MREEKRFHVFACHVRERKSQLRWPTRRPKERKRERERLQKFSNRRRKAREIKLEKCRGALRIDERTKLAIILIHLVLSKFFQIIIFNYFLLTFKF